MNAPPDIFVSVKNLSFSYGNREVLSNINLQIKQGSIVGIIGPNGGGKSTLLKIMLGLLKGYTGEINVRCLHDPEHRDSHHSCIGYVPQQLEINRRFPATVYDTVEMGLYGFTGLFGPSKKEKEYISKLIREVGIEKVKDHPITGISGGQFRRTLIARALVTKPRLIVLDEPFTGIDQSGIIRFAELLLSLKKKFELTVVLVSHDMQAIEMCSDSVACLNKTLHFHDNYHHVSPEKLSEAFSCGYEAHLALEKEIHK